MRTYFSIGEVSKMTGLTINALRHYDKIGLVTPSVVNQKTNYRYYSQNQLVLFDIIQFAKKIHLPLDELSTILNKKDMNSFKDFLSEVKGRTLNQIEDLRKTLLDLDNMQEAISNGEYLKGVSDLYQRNITERDVVTSVTLSNKINNFTIKQREKLEQEIHDNHLTTTFEQGSIYKIINNKVQQVSIYKGVNLDFDTDLDSITHIPTGNYLCITYTEKNRDIAWNKFINALNDLSLSDPLIIEQALLNDIFNPSERAYELQVYLLEALPE